ncbi:hypothetical protein B9Z33_08490 [Limnohabitans sp. T6-20]|nr:hypothetical protein B9Z33_08490 [Limnohabitans sp. T6-20]
MLTLAPCTRIPSVAVAGAAMTLAWFRLTEPASSTMLEPLMTDCPEMLRLPVLAFAVGLLYWPTAMSCVVIKTSPCAEILPPLLTRMPPGDEIKRLLLAVTKPPLTFMPLATRSKVMSLVFWACTATPSPLARFSC